jgi:dynein heavy chain
MEQHRVAPAGVYECPVYKTLTRQGELSTTGHSTNFILYMELPSGSRDSRFWVLRGVALFTSLQ